MYDSCAAFISSKEIYSMSGTYKTAKQLEYVSRFAARESSKFHFYKRE